MAITDILDEIGGPNLIDMTPEQPPPGHALQISNDDLVKLSAVHFAPIVARRCEVKRDQATVLRLIREAAAMASDDFYYSFPVRTKQGRDYIEGISVDGAMATMQAYGNCEVDCRPVDIGHSWVFLARFIDHERGTSLIRPFIQRKVGGSRLGGEDEGRRLEIASSIGASKATRNVIANAIRPYTNYCFEQAKDDLVKRVGANLESNRAAVLRHLEKLGVSLKRVEAMTGRVSAEWTAREVSGLVTQIKSIQQGLAVPNDIWPAEAPPEPRRTDATVVETPPSTASDAPSGGDGGVAAPEPVRSQQPSEPAPDASASRTIASQQSWEIGDDVVGQDALIMRLTELASRATSEADLDAIEQLNAERIAKITGTRGASLRQLFRDRRTEFKGT